MSQPLSAAPPAVAAALERLKQELVGAAGANLAGLILYGGLARGRYRPGKSDVNVVVLLNEVSAPALAAIAPALRKAQRAAGVAPMILTPAEVGPAAEVFPTKFLDIQDHHVVLHGANPFAGLVVPREQIRLEIGRQLRNLTLRLRRRYLLVLDDADQQAATLAGLARPLAIQLAALLRLAGKEVPDRSAAIFRLAAETFDADSDALARLAALRDEGRLDGGAAALYSRLLPTLARFADAAERLKEVAR
jgi:hypothetical protein